MKNFYLIDNSNRMKPQHLNKSRVQLNKNGSRLLGSIFTERIWKTVNWQNNQNIPGILTERSDSEASFESQKPSDCVKVLKSLRDGNLNKLVFDQLNINSIRNKFEFHSLDALMILETKTDDSFPIGKFAIV